MLLFSSQYMFMGQYMGASAKGSGETAQTRKSLRCSHTRNMDVDEG